MCHTVRVTARATKAVLPHDVCTKLASFEAQSMQSCLPNAQVKSMPWSGAVSYVWLSLGPPLGALLACSVREMLHRRLEDLHGLRMQ